MLGSCRLNNKSMRNVRRTDAYQAIAIDLALLGVISKEDCEMLLDGGIPSGIVLPDGSSKLNSEKKVPVQPEQTPVTVVSGNPETGDTGDETQTPETGDTEQTPVQPEPITGVTVMPGDETGNPETGDTGVQPELILGVNETQEPVNDEGRTEPNN